ncbi:MAG: bifunctional [glutamine synthetase] adenylyltransferase/[glutamine synthetase]-adenylyl-L-tyrosine phosphorylase [Candidatus Ancillula sp.]|jgi:glutamate-ammonia-ligase adenylyltransferase|nr:bifunctional [glutamine synthetase] adenylyltransferase/[glutamine synthetase]-adenylyl-L-tyrosine phosphorylase [Candidatus Ancillula sp.]
MSYISKINSLRKSYHQRFDEIKEKDFLADKPTEILPEIMQNLSDLATDTIESALNIALGEILGSGEDKIDLDTCGFIVVAMGKCGARELNYISDIDLVYLANEDLVNSSKANKIAIKIQEIFNGFIGEELPLVEIDTALRPEGKAGPLVRTLDSTKAYFEKWAVNWEFQALLKARVVAGDKELGKSYVDFAEEQLWKAAKRENFVSDSRKMRQRVIDNIPLEEKDREIKLGEGGLRDIEFTVQLLQLVHGEDDSTIRAKDTLSAISELKKGGYIGHLDAEEIDYDYRFLRVIEHRLQVFQNKRTHLFPINDGGVGTDLIYQLAKSFKMNKDEFLEKYQKTRINVRRIHLQIYFRPIVTLAAQNLQESENSRFDSKAMVIMRLQSLGFEDPSAAYLHIQSMIKGSGRKNLVIKQALPAILMWIANGHYKQYALLTFRKIFEKIGDLPWFVSLLRDSHIWTGRVCWLFSGSKKICDWFYQYPDLLKQIDNDDDLLVRTKESLEKEFSATFDRHFGDESKEDLIRRLDRIRSKELLRLAVGFLVQTIDLKTTQQAISNVTDILILYALKVLGAKDVEPIAMGRYGGEEMGFSSDADLVFVNSNRVDSNIASKQISQFKRLFDIDLGSSSFGLELDFELRPEGKSGLLSRSFESYQKYYEQFADIWEFQALLRARVLSKDGELTELINNFRYQQNLNTPKNLLEIKRIKARVENEREKHIGSSGVDYKLDKGGLSDIEWLVQIYQLQSTYKIPELKTTSTLKAIEILKENEIFTEKQSKTLTKAWKKASILRNLEALDWQNFGSKQEEVEKFKHLARKARKVYEKLF